MADMVYLAQVQNGLKECGYGFAKPAREHAPDDLLGIPFGDARLYPDSFLPDGPPRLVFNNGAVAAILDPLEDELVAICCSAVAAGLYSQLVLVVVVKI